MRSGAEEEEEEELEHAWSEGVRLPPLLQVSAACLALVVRAATHQITRSTMHKMADRNHDH